MTDRLKSFGDPKKPSKVEKAKQASRHLRGSIDEVLHSDAPIFEHDDMQLLKFHGIYQQDDRDARAAGKAAGIGRQYSFMLRLRIPGGVVSGDQYLAMDRLADQVTFNSSLRITTRQAFQLHGVIKDTLKQTMQRINRELLSTMNGCGDVERNIMAPPAPLKDSAHVAVRELANELADRLAQKSNAYFEVWLDGEKVDTSEEADDLYGQAYLPRKFKTGIALPDDNAADVYTQDVGLIAIPDAEGNIQGANILVGGGLGMTHKKPETYARLGSKLGYVDREHIVDAVKTIVTIHRDFGDRSDRKHARLKYIVEEQGLDAVPAEFMERADFDLKPWVECGDAKHQDWLGKHEQGDGRFFYGVYVPSGRIIDGQTIRMKTAFGMIVEAIGCEVILTPNQNVIFADLTDEHVKQLERILSAFNVPRVEDMTAVQRYGMSCVALPTCGLALTEAERVFGDVVKDLETEFMRLGVEDSRMTVRMTGCPNGCARPYNADIGLVGHKPGHYDIFLGGRLDGDRMAEFYAMNVPMDEITPTLRPILERWAADRMPEETLGDFYNRVFADGAERHLATGDRENPAIDRVQAAWVGSG